MPLATVKSISLHTHKHTHKHIHAERSKRKKERKNTTYTHRAAAAKAAAASEQTDQRDSNRAKAKVCRPGKQNKKKNCTKTIWMDLVFDRITFD